MSWLTVSAFEPALPAHCEPVNDFLFRFSSAFHTCVPTPLAFISSSLGILSIVAWLFAQLPQIYKNWSISSTSGLSIFFLVEWCLGDLGNLLGALFTHQASWQVAIGAYYVFVDLCLVVQWLWYERLRHGNVVRRVWPKGKRGSGSDAGDGRMNEVVIEGLSISPTTSQDASEADARSAGQPKHKQTSRPQIIFRTPTFEQDPKTEEEKASSSLSHTPSGTSIYRVGSSSPMPSPSPRTILLIACLMAMAHASPLTQIRTPIDRHTTEANPTALETAGTILSWTSTVLYLGSRLPQLLKNWRRKSTAGLSPHLFIAAFCGNSFYSAALMSNPCVWNDYGPYGGRGWTGANGSQRTTWILAGLPFFLGAAGVLALDASVGVQFLTYGDAEAKIIVIEEQEGRRWHWRRVSGWMRGWMPSTGEGKVDEHDALLERSERQGEGYGTL